MAGPGSFVQTVTPKTNTNSVGTKFATSNSGAQQNGGAVSLPGGSPGPQQLPNPLVSTVVVAPGGIITVTQASDAGTPPNQVTLTFTTQPANGVFAGPSSGGAAAPSFRSLVAADFSNQNANLVLSGPVSGGAGSVTFRNIVAADFGSQSINLILASPASGGAGAPTFRNIVGADFGTETAKTFLAGPTSGGAAAPTFRAIANTDMPASNFSGTAVLAALTGGGTQGSLTIVNGLITAYIAPT